MNSKNFTPPTPPKDVSSVIESFPKPTKAVVTSGMPYATGPLHLGHLAGSFIPADIHARWLRQWIGNENVLYVCGTDDHGSTTEVSAIKAGKPIQEFLGELREHHRAELQKFHVSFNVYSGTSMPETFPIHKEISQNFMKVLYDKGFLAKKVSHQWFDPKMNRFLQDRFVRGKCPNPQCSNTEAYSDECEVCGTKYDPSELIDPRSSLSDATPVLKDTPHWWLDMTKVSETLRIWIQSKKTKWRLPVYNEVINMVLPSLIFDNTHEEKFKEIKSSLPLHKSKYAPGKKIVAQFENKKDLESAEVIFKSHQIPTEIMDKWAYRSFTRDVAWGIPLPEVGDPEMMGKTLYVWPDSLIAPIAFTQVALKKMGRAPEEYKQFWMDPHAKIYQFLGQDNVFFYVLMQGAMWMGMQSDFSRLPIEGELQLTEVLGCSHLLVNGEKMSKSRGNFLSGLDLLSKGYSADQIRYFFATLSLPDKPSSFDFEAFNERNKFLSGPMNAAFEKPLSAAHSKFQGMVPEGKVTEKVLQETIKLTQRYMRAMERSEYVVLLGAIENYARQINSLFTQFKPHDDRFPIESRNEALFNCFYILKNIMIMLYPFAPETMDRVRQSLNLSERDSMVSEIGKPIPAGHRLGPQLTYFPPATDAQEPAQEHN